MIRILLLFVVLFIVACRNNEHIEYYENGQIKYYVKLKNGKRNGIATKYDQNGSVIQTSSWQDGFKEGLTVTYYTNGSKHQIANFKRNIQTGWYYKYDSTGVLLEESFFENGLINGESKTFFQNGQLLAKANLLNDTLQGNYYQYFEDGNLQLFRVYQKGEVEYSKRYDRDNNLIDYTLPLRLEILKKNGSSFLRVELEYTNLDSPMVGVLIGRFSGDEKEILDTIKIADNIGLSVDIKIEDYFPNQIEGLLFEIDNKSSNYEAFQYFSIKNDPM